MDDCFSLQNAADLVEELREAASEDDSITFNYKYIEEIADAIEQLLSENATLKELYDKLDWERINLKAELDAAIHDIPRNCDLCKHWKNWMCKFDNLCVHIGHEYTGWEWRGVQKEEEK